MQIETTRRETDTLFTLYKESAAIGRCRCERAGSAVRLRELFIDPAWRRRGYGSYLLKHALRLTGGFEAESLHTAPAPQDAAGRALLAKFGFVPADAGWQRSRRPDPTAVGLTHAFLQNALRPGGFYIDATCGNGHDTAFLCRLAGPGGRVLALDVPAQAVENTARRLHALGFGSIARVIRADHAQLARLAGPANADCVVFNFGYLPGADHALFTTQSTTLPALRAALELLKPGGVLAACLYSGGPNGSGEKQAALAFLRGLPLTSYTVLVCEFANWAPTAPLPCFVVKK